MSDKLPGAVSLKTDEGTVLLMNLDHKDVQDAFEKALDATNRKFGEALSRLADTKTREVVE